MGAMRLLIVTQKVDENDAILGGVIVSFLWNGMEI